MRCHYLRLAVFLPLLLAACKVGLPSGDPADLLAEGKRTYEEKAYKTANRYFRSITKRYPEAGEAEEALFFEAECRRHRRQGPVAFETYKKFVEKYPNSRYAVGVALGEYRLGVDHFEGRIPSFLIFGKDRAFGVRILEHMQINFRNHSLADDALMRVVSFHLEKRDYADATRVARRLLAEYPRSEHMLWARFQLARSLWLQNQGALYDERLLIDARRAFEDYVGTARLAGMEQKQSKQIEAARKMIVKIDERRAEKEFTIGRFYERTDRLRAAMYYYEHCIRSYPQTEGAVSAQQRLRKLRAPAGEEPDAGEKKPEAATG